jgi:virulence-associated protein VagC
MADVAKVFMSGRSQAGRLPKPYRFDCEEVEITRQGDAVVLRPRRANPWATWRRRWRSSTPLRPSGSTGSSCRHKSGRSWMPCSSDRLPARHQHADWPPASRTAAEGPVASALAAARLCRHFRGRCSRALLRRRQVRPTGGEQAKLRSAVPGTGATRFRARRCRGRGRDPGTLAGAGHAHRSLRRADRRPGDGAWPYAGHVQPARVHPRRGPRLRRLVRWLNRR